MRAVLCRAYGPADTWRSTPLLRADGRAWRSDRCRPRGRRPVRGQPCRRRQVVAEHGQARCALRPADDRGLSPSSPAWRLRGSSRRSVRAYALSSVVTGCSAPASSDAFAEMARFRRAGGVPHPRSDGHAGGGRLLFRVFHGVLLAHPPGRPEERRDRAGARSRRWRGDRYHGNCEGGGRTRDRGTLRPWESSPWLRRTVPTPSSDMQAAGHWRWPIKRNSHRRSRKATDGRGFEVIADLVGGDYAEPAMRTLALKGRYPSIGFSAGIPSIPMHVIFNKNGAILGIEPVADKRLAGRSPGCDAAALRVVRREEASSTGDGDLSTRARRLRRSDGSPRDRRQAA